MQEKNTSPGYSRLFTVWNDRPQAGSVHYDGSLKLLIDRQIKTQDRGGISEPMTSSAYRDQESLQLEFLVGVSIKDDLNGS